MDKVESIILSVIPIGATKTPVLAVITPEINGFSLDLILGNSARGGYFKPIFYSLITS